MRYKESSKSIQNTVIYDGGCGLCQSLASWASEKTVKDLEFIDSESIEPENYGLSRKDFDKYIWLIQSDQKKIKGVFAIAEILKRMGFSWMILGFIILTPPFSFAATGVYALVAKNRKRFGNCCS
ncbi:MAG: DUF393 domain-containing protein [Acidimicrobiales bacterium]|nr:DUF393 domain-containing protein [Acidimicrobiales bacterium]